LGAGIGALLAMVFVPCIHQGYEPIFNAAEYRINVAQLVLNISFAALVGALAFNLSRRAGRKLLVVERVVGAIAEGKPEQCSDNQAIQKTRLRPSAG